MTSENLTVRFAASSLLIFPHQCSGVAKLLEAGPGGFTLEALLDEDEFIQETQAQSAALKDL